MIQGEINRSRAIVLIRVSGRFHPGQMGDIDSFANRLAGREGPFDLILDFSSITATDVPVQEIAKRGERPQLWPDRQRILVAPQPVLHALMRVFAGYQELNGMRRPLVVGRLDEAFERFGTRREEFQPIEAEGTVHAMTALAPTAILAR